MKAFIVCVLLLVSLALCAEEIPKKEICLIGCKMLKKDWQKQLCEIACDQIKADTEFDLKSIAPIIANVRKILTSKKIALADKQVDKKVKKIMKKVFPIAKKMEGIVIKGKLEVTPMSDAEIKVPEWMKDALKRLPKKEICLEACKAFKKDWEQDLCKIACNQIKEKELADAPDMETIIAYVKKIAKQLWNQLPKREICETACKAFKKDWQIEMCQAACHAIKEKPESDTEIKVPSWMKKVGKQLKNFWKRMPKQEMCLNACKAFKKDWEIQACEVACKQIKEKTSADKMPKWVGKVGKELKEGLKRLPKKELCLEACVAFKKDWQKQMCEVGCNQIKADSESTQSINQRGVDLVKSFEGWYSCKYKDPVGLWTIGFGHLIKGGETFNHCLSKQEGEDLLKRDLSSFDRCVSNAVKVPLNSNQFSALVSFSFNVGCGNLQSSTLLRELNGGNRADVCNQLARWNKAGGKVLPGLTRRRSAECELFRA